MTVGAVQRRVIRQLLGADPVRPADLHTRQGYSMARRVLADLLGVQLPERTGSVPSGAPPTRKGDSASKPSAATIPNGPAVPMVLDPAPHASGPSHATVSLAEQFLNASDREQAAAVTFAALSPGTRLAMRGQSIVLSIIISDLLTRALAIAIVAYKFRSHRGRVTQEVGELNRGLEVASRVSRDLYPSSTLVPDLTHARDLAFDHALSLVLAIEDDSADVGILARDFALDLARLLARILARNRDFSSTLDLDLGDLDHALHSVLNISASVDEVAARRIGLDGDLRLAPALLAGALVDFTQADLSGVDISNVSLVGIFWSKDGTRWPTGTDAARLVDLSVETDPGSGMYLITRNGGTGQDRAVVPT